MRCFVASCKNDTRHISKSHGITFHAIPTERNLRKAWLKAIGKEAWTPKERCTICSDHFLTEDLYVTKNGLRKVRNGAVPVIMQNEPSSKHDGDDNLNVCRICLAIDNKVFPITKYRLEMAYESLTGISATEDNLPKKLCMECAQRLQNSTKFKKKCLQAYSLLMDVAASFHSGQLTLQSIKNLDRYENQLHSCLKIKKIEPDHYDYNIEYKENLNTEDNVTDFKDDEIKLEDQYAIPVLDLVKDETENNEIFLNETDDFDDNKDLVDDDNYVASDKDYSTDDSLPLERRRTKKEKVKKKAKAVKEVKRKPGRKAIEKATEPKIDRRRKPFLNNDLNDILFTITDLTLEEQIADIQKRQESANFKNSVFKCMECYKGFLDEDAYNSHMSRHTDQCGEYACAICKTHFKHSHALRKHITAHHSQRFCCNQCPYVTTHRQTARLHERWHKGTKYKCPHCEDEFVKFTTYMGHIRIKHPSDFVCELCGYSFVSEKGIELHKKLKHRMDDVQIPPDAPYCEQCNVRFISEEAYRRHLSVSARHNADDKDKKANVSKLNRKPRQMRDRMKEKEEESELDRKMYPSQMRKAEGPIPCEQCGLQLEDSRAYHGHFRRMHPDKNRTNYPSMKSPCMCEVCGRMFQSFALLRDHTWTHTGERPFKCDSCDKCFRMKQRLVAHRRVHSQMKATYACAHCGKHFSTHSNRQRHMFIHTGLKPFKCEMCGKCFKHASEKRAHINYVHLKKPWPKRTRGKRRDGRTGPLPLNQGMGGSEMDIVQPIWPCDQKLDMNMMDDKPMYYNLKI